MDEQKEDNFIVGIFGVDYDQRELIGQALGSPDTKSDIQIFGRLDVNFGQVFCALTPVDYPEKIKPFIQILRISNIHLLVIDLEIGLNAVIGEILVGMDIMHQIYETGTLVVITGINSKTEWKIPELRKNVEEIINTTTLKGTNIVEIREKEDYEKLKKEIIKLGLKLHEAEKKASDNLKIFIDHVFLVKGIGTVILGIVKRGTINAGQMVEIIGYDGPPKKAIVRSIQKHDRNFKQASQGDRIGLALKGNISPKDISRDNLIVSQGIYKQENQIKAEVFVNKFYKPKTGKIIPGDNSQFYAFSELKMVPLKFIEGVNLIPGSSGIVSLRLERSLVHDGNGIRGIVTELNRFDDKLRIVGYFKQIIN